MSLSQNQLQNWLDLADTLLGASVNLQQTRVRTEALAERNLANEIAAVQDIAVSLGHNCEEY
jgi:type VI protein secretion system component VasF